MWFAAKHCWRPSIRWPAWRPQGAPRRGRGDRAADLALGFGQKLVDGLGTGAGGFDAVEVHGAHGYLVDQFFWAGTNLRADRYGGPTLRERARFAAEVIAAIRAAVGVDYPLILRVSQWKQQDLKVRLAKTPAAMAEWLVPLVEAGADVLHCSQRRSWTPEFPELDGEVGLNFAGWTEKLTGAATISWLGRAVGQFHQRVQRRAFRADQF